ncbi:MAG TPA: Scr1 family TA system antitoxin-like transcriptional regulator [Actinophytocola sp.]|uniref:Scr1 family TA system antitoxin-like transcriptional regulator n=1 Tax=Actinophytocola sp. TaxID=1872138 RepID=UPI002DBB5E18|nr:Scr1 family TA system antitoxin-like transcriptional regulator [Actinophytocola sp.]HEU5474769.1 Scr1 family TA system antitoxin-like transcriptional regulator [Actinophytocola sp.]
MARLRRQQILGTVDYTAYICQAALRIPFGGAQALKEQVQRLAEAHIRGIQVRVVPERLPHAVMLHSWLLLEFPHASPVVNVEVMNGGVYLHDDDARAYLSALDALDRVALSASASRHMLQQTAEEL